MESFMELVKKRRSVRAYEEKDIKRSDLELCVEAARYAPSACNSQPWKFIIIDEPAKKAEAMKSVSGLYNMNTFAREAAAFIAVISEKQKVPAWLGGKIRKTDFRRIDVGIACENVILQAEELGIGTCILGWFDEKKLKKSLNVPKNKRIELLIAMGYPIRTEKLEKYLKDTSEVRSFNHY